MQSVTRLESNAGLAGREGGDVFDKVAVPFFVAGEVEELNYVRNGGAVRGRLYDLLLRGLLRAVLRSLPRHERSPYSQNSEASKDSTSQEFAEGTAASVFIAWCPVPLAFNILRETREALDR